MGRERETEEKLSEEQKKGVTEYDRKWGGEWRRENRFTGRPS